MSKKCIACGERLYNSDYALCNDCWNETNDYFEEKKYSYYTEHDLITHYHNIYCLAKKEKKFAKVVELKNKMIAIALIQKTRYHNKDIWCSRLKNDLLSLDGLPADIAQPILDDQYLSSFIVQPLEERRYITEDNHIVRSENEAKIDNMLYRAQIAHAYEKKVDEITERNVYCDWYIPVIGDTGIYIELWGHMGKKYELNRAEKTKLYKKHKLNLITFDSANIPDDQQMQVELVEKITQKKKDILEKEIKKLKESNQAERLIQARMLIKQLLD